MRKNLVSFDMTQDRESLDHARDLELVERPVERPFHHLRTDGDGTEKVPKCSSSLLPPGIMKTK
jgi:hypothetical protein